LDGLHLWVTARVRNWGRYHDYTTHWMTSVLFYIHTTLIMTSG